MNNNYTSKPFLIIAMPRSGGTLLSHCLDSHPQIYCHRGEPLHKRDSFREYLDQNDALRIATSMRGYEWSGAKITTHYYRGLGGQLWLNSFFLDFEAKIIFLYRQDLLRLIVSEAIRKLDKENGLHAHAYEKRQLVRVELNIETIAIEYHTLNKRRQIIRDSLLPFNPLELSYEEMTENDEISHLSRNLVSKLTNFFEVAKYPLFSLLRKRNNFPLNEIILNYQEVIEVLKGLGYETI